MSCWRAPAMCPPSRHVRASWLLQKYVPEIKVRVVNVVDLSLLMSPDDHPHGMDDISFEALFTEAAPVIFAFHGYPWVIHPMVHGRSNEARFHVRGFMDEARPPLRLTWSSSIR